MIENPKPPRFKRYYSGKGKQINIKMKWKLSKHLESNSLGRTTSKHPPIQTPWPFAIICTGTASKAHFQISLHVNLKRHKPRQEPRRVRKSKTPS